MGQKIKFLTFALSVTGLLLLVFFLRKDPQDWLGEVKQYQESTTTGPAQPSQSPYVDQPIHKAEVSQKSGEPIFNQNLRLVEDDDQESPLSFADMDAIEELFDEVEEKWSQKMKDLFVSELTLGEEAYKKYQMLRDEYDIAKLEAYEAYHERMIEQHGPDYPYQASLQVEDFDNVALPEFYKRLEREIGLDALRRYIQVKDDFNEELRRNQPPGPAQILVDF